MPSDLRVVFDTNTLISAFLLPQSIPRQALDSARLPEPKTVRGWSGSEYAAVLRHDQKDPAYNRHFRQLLHVGFKVAAELGDTWYHALAHHADVIGQLVTENLLEKHIKPVFL